MRFEWNDENANTGNYECNLYDDDDKRINHIYFTDYTCEWHHKYDKYPRPYSFEVLGGQKGFDYDEEYYTHYFENNLRGGYNGNSTHTVDDIKRWCENWLAQRCLWSYYHVLAELDTLKRRAECLESQGFKLEVDTESEDEE